MLIILLKLKLDVSLKLNNYYNGSVTTDAKKTKKDNSQSVLYCQRVQLSRVRLQGPIEVNMALMVLNKYCMMTFVEVLVIILTG